ncbi:MAG: bifunctional serine/threonine-protein kinase/ABC transporter substrate-binding protein [Gemmatimonadetes bacterium]|nr:bifunctional serine/threonine-protein kinase/ABC transporter substrate-binding protein [Gemmatimonadota bacterium]
MTDVIERLRSELRGRYAVLEELGAGGMATVYLAEDVKHRRKVAVKVLRPELTAAVGAERFLKEIEIAAGLRHPHILPLHDSGQAGEFLYYVMPFVEGESLRDRLNREKQLAIDEAVRIAREVAEALSYAHAHGVIHRDIKPANIMLESGHAVVADFGIAFSVEQLDSGRLTDSGLSPGTPLYMSPEQAGGERHLDARSDIYSVGCVLYEMLSGDPPFTAATVQAIIARKMVESVPSLQVVRDTIPDALQRITLKALARTPADRFTTAGELASALATVEAQASGALFGLGGLAERQSGSVPDAAAVKRSAAGTPNGRGGRMKQVAGYGLAGLLFLTVVGFLNTRVVDIKLGVPVQYTPSRIDFPIVGLQALVPLIFYSLGVGFTLHRLQGDDFQSFWHWSVPFRAQARVPIGRVFRFRGGVKLDIYPPFDTGDFAPLIVNVSTDKAEAVLGLFIGFDLELF